MKRVGGRKKIAIVGAGRLGKNLVYSLKEAGYEISEIIHRPNSVSHKQAASVANKIGARVSVMSRARLDADVIWFCVPDDSLEHAGHGAAASNWQGKIAFHSSGALTSDVLRILRDCGASVASAHPLMTFVKGARPALAGVPFAVEGDTTAARVAGEIVKALGGRPFRIGKQDKVAYHAFATMICPLLVSLLATSEKVGIPAGMSSREARRRMMPIIRQTLANYERLGPAGSFSGPIVRGDAKTIRRHLQALGKIPEAKRVYSALVAAALKRLPNKNAKQISDALFPQTRSTHRSEKDKDRGDKRRVRHG